MFLIFFHSEVWNFLKLVPSAVDLNESYNRYFIVFFILLELASFANTMFLPRIVLFIAGFRHVIRS